MRLGRSLYLVRWNLIVFISILDESLSTFSHCTHVAWFLVVLHLLHHVEFALQARLVLCILKLWITLLYLLQLRVEGSFLESTWITLIRSDFLLSLLVLVDTWHYSSCGEVIAKQLLGLIRFIGHLCVVTICLIQSWFPSLLIVLNKKFDISLPLWSWSFNLSYSMITMVLIVSDVIDSCIRLFNSS